MIFGKNFKAFSYKSWLYSFIVSKFSRSSYCTYTKFRITCILCVPNQSSPSNHSCCWYFMLVRFMTYPFNVVRRPFYEQSNLWSSVLCCPFHDLSVLWSIRFMLSVLWPILLMLSVLWTVRFMIYPFYVVCFMLSVLCCPFNEQSVLWPILLMLSVLCCPFHDPSVL